MISGDEWCPSFPDLCLTVEEKSRKKTQQGKQDRPKIKSGPSRFDSSTTAVVGMCCSIVNRKEINDYTCL